MLHAITSYTCYTCSYR